MHARVRFSLLAAVALLAGAGCQGPTPHLSRVEVPAGFTFRAVKTVHVALTLDAAAALPASTALELRTPDGRVVYRGGIGPGRTVDLRLPIATAHQELVAVLDVGGGGERRFSLPLGGNEVTSTLR